MEFEGQYLTYSEYQELGGTLDQMPFNLLEYSSRKEIDLNTKLRLQDVDNIPNEVKLCMFELINTLNKYVQDSDFNVNYSSESIDGYSKSYATAGQIREIVKSKQVELDDIILRDLFGVIVNNEHLIYRG